MNAPRFTRHTVSIMLIAGAAFSMLLSACQAGNVSADVPTVQPTATMIPMPTTVTATKPAPSSSSEFLLDLSGVAQNQTLETVTAVPASADKPWWEASPAHRLVTLQGYPVTEHLIHPQIFVYPVVDLANFNEAAGMVATDLNDLLQSKQAGDMLPFLPLYNAQQVMHAQVQFIDFKNGKGVRFLTQFDQAPLMINNYELIYTFQGLTNDGKYYVAAVLPVTNPELPATQQVSPDQAAQLSDFPAYLTKTVTWLDQQSAGSFTPDLAKLDALVQSIEVK